MILLDCIFAVEIKQSRYCQSEYFAQQYSTIVNILIVAILIKSV